MELKELHVLHGYALPQGDGWTIAGQGMGVGRDLEHPSHATGGKQNRLGAEGMDLAVEYLVGRHAAGYAVLDQQIDDVVFVKELDVVADALLIQSLQDHVSRPVGGIARAAHRPLPKVVGVTAERPLGNLAIRCAVKGQAPVLQFIDCLDGFARHDFGGILVDQVVAALDRVEHVPFPKVLLGIAQRCADASLGCPSVGTGGIELAEYGHAANLAQLEGRA